VPLSTLEPVAAALKVLAHPHRLQIVERLMERDLTVGELADALGLPPAACSQHLTLMRAHGLLAARREGRTVHYRVVAPAAINLIQCIHRHEPAS
jgi:ArsR family transcriptional regulator